MNQHLILIMLLKLFSKKLIKIKITGINMSTLKTTSTPSRYFQ